MCHSIIGWHIMFSRLGKTKSMSANDLKKQDKNEWRLKKYLDGFGNIFALNVCFIIACIPIITIGASLTATYAMSIRLQENEEETILHGFIHEFKRCFKQSTIAFIIVIILLIILYGEFLVVNNFSGFISTFYFFVLVIELLLFSLSTTFLFPILARYNNSIKNCFKNSFLLSVGYRWSWLKINVAWIAPIALSIIYPTIFLQTWYFWFLLFFGAIIYGTSYTVRYVFNQNKIAFESDSLK